MWRNLRLILAFTILASVARAGGVILYVHNTDPAESYSGLDADGGTAEVRALLPLADATDLEVKEVPVTFLTTLAERVREVMDAHDTVRAVVIAGHGNADSIAISKDGIYTPELLAEALAEALRGLNVSPTLTVYLASCLSAACDGKSRLHERFLEAFQEARADESLRETRVEVIGHPRFSAPWSLWTAGVLERMAHRTRIPDWVSHFDLTGRWTAASISVAVLGTFSSSHLHPQIPVLSAAWMLSAGAVWLGSTILSAKRVNLLAEEDGRREEKTGFARDVLSESLKDRRECAEALEKL